MLGICCMWMRLDDKGSLVNETPIRRLQLSRISSYTEDEIQGVYTDNLRSVCDLLVRAHVADINFVRISSALFPLWDKVPRYLWDSDEVKALLKKIGSFVTEHEMRLNTHPDQHFVLSSDKPHVVDTTVQELNFQGWIFDEMGLPQTPYYNINVHGGKGDREEALVAGIARLGPAARNRLTLENCEFAYTVEDLYKVYDRTGVPVVVDVHHHSINPGRLTTMAALEIGTLTWPDEVRPTTHLSNSKPGITEDDKPSKRRAHSDYIRVFQPDLLAMHQEGRVDVEIEAKAKNLAILPLMEQINE